MESIDWSKKNIFFLPNEIQECSDPPKPTELRKKIEPWLTAVFQSEHLSLLLGTGLTTGVCKEASVCPTAMQRIDFESFEYKDEISAYADKSADSLERGHANFEDDFRSAMELLNGLLILEDDKSSILEDIINKRLIEFVQALIANERSVIDSPRCKDAINLLKRFLISFSSRTATRDRLHIFTTNYDRFIEYALDSAGIYILDRFIGKLKPIMRMHKIELDYHYNPPGIRGEPHYVEGVVRYTKLHGSLDWRLGNNEIYKYPLPFGEEPKDISNPYDSYIIYPNASKGIDTAYFPYSELFRDFSSAVCRPNSVLVTYGYGFGDSHINRIIHDMLTIPSTHLVIISFDTADGRIEKFVSKCNESQLTLLIGNHFGNMRDLSENYLPKPAIDRITDREQKILEKRGKNQKLSPKDDDSDAT
ncbi:MAG: SIR2 family protein [Bacteroidales bacterium]|jgi:hypothetical protein|nr:SIR2 family protein [Bacteroidales bacterium]